MNLLPLINRSKRQPFVSPLAGKMYRSQHGSQHKAQMATISHVESHRAHKGKAMNKMSTIQTEHKLKQSYIQSEALTDRQVRLSEGAMKLSKTIDSDLLELIKPSRKQRPRNLQTFFFPKVQIVPLYLVNSHADIKKTTLSISLQQYFKLFFQRQIEHNRKELIQIFLENVPKLKSQGVLDRPVVKQKWPAEFWDVKSTDDLLALIRGYSTRGSQYWDKYVLTLLQIYCVPEQSVRANCLDNLILLINKQLDRQLNIQVTTEPLQFLFEDGTPVDDFLDIPFSVQKLYLVSKEKSEESFASFRAMVKQHSDIARKNGLTGKLRSHFRREIVPNKYDEYSVNYRSDFSGYRKERKNSIQKAMELLGRKKIMGKNTKTALSSPIREIQRPKSRQSAWREENVEDVEVEYQTTTDCFFHINLGSRKLENEAKSDFRYYCGLSKEADKEVAEGEIAFGVLEKHHPVLKQLAQNRFHNDKLRRALEIVITTTLPQHHAAYTIQWMYFLQLWVLCSKDIQRLVDQPDCYQLLRNFVESYLEMKDQDYFREELTAKLFCSLEGEGESLSMMQQVIWSWLCENGFVEHQAIQRELLWTFPSRSKTFYLLIASIVLGTFKTTPLDLAHQLLL